MVNAWTSFSTVRILAVLLANVCAGFIRFCYGVCWEWRFLGYSGCSKGFCSYEEVPALLVFPLMCTGPGLRSCAHRWTRPLGGGRWVHYLPGLREFAGFPFKALARENWFLYDGVVCRDESSNIYCWMLPHMPALARLPSLHG